MLLIKFTTLPADERETADWRLGRWYATRSGGVVQLTNMAWVNDYTYALRYPLRGFLRNAAGEQLSFQLSWTLAGRYIGDTCAHEHDLMPPGHELLEAAQQQAAPLAAAHGDS